MQNRRNGQTIVYRPPRPVTQTVVYYLLWIWEIQADVEECRLESRSTMPPKAKKRPAPSASGDETPTAKKAKTTSTEATGKDNDNEGENRKAAIKKSLQKNPENVFVIGPSSDNWVDNAACLAGYLGLTGNLEAFRRFLLGTGTPAVASQLTHNILENYIQIRSVGYGKPAGTGPGASQAVGARNISNKQIWLALGETDANYQRLFRSDVSLPLPADSGFVPGDTAHAIAVNVAAMSFVIHHNPHIFVEAHAPLAQRRHCVGRTAIPAEEWYRALLLIKFYHRQTTDAKKEKGFLSKDQSKLKPREMKYFTPEDVEGVDRAEVEEAEGDLEGRTPGEKMASVYAELVGPPDEPVEDSDGEDVDVELMGGVAAEWEVAVEEVDKKLRRQDHPVGSAGRTTKRIRMNEHQLRQACVHIGNLCKVKHDDPTMDDVLQPLAISSREEVLRRVRDVEVWR